MARLKKNAVLGELSGKVGNLVLRQVGGQSIVQTLPVRQAPYTPGELDNQKNFKEAELFAKQAKLNPELWAFYTAEAKRRGGTNNARAMAISDYRVGPVLHNLTLLPATKKKPPVLVIHATDNIAVARVEIRLLRADGSEVESGLAMRIGETDRWEYEVAAVVGIWQNAEVLVFDWAGNSVKG